MQGGVTSNITFNTVKLFITYNVYTYSSPRNGMYKCLVAEETILRTHFGFPSTYCPTNYRIKCSIPNNLQVNIQTLILMFTRQPRHVHTQPRLTANKIFAMSTSGPSVLNFRSSFTPPFHVQ
jgi:hypothetical protein